MDDKYLVGLDDYKVLDEENPIGYTRDIHSCIVLLIHREKDSILLHIESLESEIYLDNFLELIKVDKENPIKDVDIFLGKYSSIGNLSIIKFILHKLNIKYEVYDVFVNRSNETSVGYNYNTKEYYMVRMDKGKPNFTRKLVK